MIIDNYYKEVANFKIKKRNWRNNFAKENLKGESKVKENIEAGKTVTVTGIVENGKPVSDGYSIGDNATITGFANQ